MVLFKGSKTRDVSAMSIIDCSVVKILISLLDQRLDLQKLKDEDPEPVRGQVVVSLLSKECSRNSSRLQNIVIADHVRSPSTHSGNQVRNSTLIFHC